MGVVSGIFWEKGRGNFSQIMGSLYILIEVWVTHVYNFCHNFLSKNLLKAHLIFIDFMVNCMQKEKKDI